MSGAELKTDSMTRWVMYSREAYGGGRIYLTTEQDQEVARGKEFSQRAYADVWAKDAGLVERVRSFLVENFHWHQRFEKNGTALEVIETLQSMIRGESVVLIAKRPCPVQGWSDSAPAPERPRSFREHLMISLGMSKKAATDYIAEYYNTLEELEAFEARRTDALSPAFNINTTDTSKNPGKLADAQPYKYDESTALDQTEQLAGGDGTPGNNQAQNRQFRAVVKVMGLNKDEAQQLHRDISGEDLGYHDILERAQDMFGQ